LPVVTSARRRILPFASLILALSGCSYSVGGEALPAPGAVPTSPSAPTTPGGPPKIAKARKVAGADPCKLLDATALQPIGKLRDQPRRRDEQIPESCQFYLDDSSPNAVSVITALYKKYEDVRSRQPKGEERIVDGNSAWTLCDVQASDLVCTSAVAVSSDRTLLVGFEQRGASADTVLVHMQPLIKAALNRLPTA
jgi:hypothetical protein